MSTDVTGELVRTLVENVKVLPEDWTALALVLGFDGEKVNSVHGFVHSVEGKLSGTSASPFDIRSAVEAYTGSHYASEGALPVSLLVQFDRTRGRYEDDDETRWKATPSNSASVREELRARFD